MTGRVVSQPGYTLPLTNPVMVGYKKPCRFCGNLVEELSVMCPFCGRAHPLQAVCPYCIAPIQPGWAVCNTCTKPLVIPCPRCGAQVGPDTDVCDRCKTVVRYRCPTCVVVIAVGDKKCPRCGTKLKEYWKSKGL